MTTVGLIHGAGQGGWVWVRVIRELEELGYRGVAMDLPSDDPAATLSDYRDAALRALAPYEDLAVLVGHSFGGITIPLVAERRPVRRLVFLCAVVPLPGKSRLEHLREDPSQIHRVVAEALIAGRTEPPGSTEGMLTHDVTPEDAALMRQGARSMSRADMIKGVLAEKNPLRRWPAAEYRVILATQDRAVMPDWSRRIAHELFRTEALEIEGGHMLPLTRPREVAEAIVGGL